MPLEGLYSPFSLICSVVEGWGTLVLDVVGTKMKQKSLRGFVVQDLEFYFMAQLCEPWVDVAVGRDERRFGAARKKLQVNVPLVYRE